jgi:hypothetical protein
LYSNKETRRTAIKKHSGIIAAATIMVVIASAAMILGIQSQTSQKVLAQTSSKGAANATVVTVNPNQSTNKTFWINTVHVDGNTNIHAAVACDTCSQNTPLHPAEKFPNTTVIAGPGLVLRPPNKVGAWDFRAFAFDPSMIVVNQGDKVTLHFVGVQGFHHVITVEGVGTFQLDRAQIHTVSFIASNPGTITYYCHIHFPNMVGQILVLPRAA